MSPHFDSHHVAIYHFGTVCTIINIEGLFVHTSHKKYHYQPKILFSGRSEYTSNKYNASKTPIFVDQTRWYPLHESETKDGYQRAMGSSLCGRLSGGNRTICNSISLSFVVSSKSPFIVSKNESSTSAPKFPMVKKVVDVSDFWRELGNWAFIGLGRLEAVFCGGGRRRFS